MGLSNTFSEDSAVAAFITQRGIVGVPAASGATRYDLGPLLIGPDGSVFPGKVNLFATDTKFTFVRAIRDQQTVYEDTELERTYSLWRKNWSVTLSAKQNLDGSGSFNLYTHTERKRLQNLTSRPEKVLATLPELLHELFMVCVMDLHERRLRPWRTVPVDSNQARAAALLYNTYPAFFVDQVDLGNRVNEFLNEVPSALYPLLRQGSPARLVDALFGQDADERFYELGEAGLSPQLLTAGYLFGRVAPPEALLRLDVSPASVPLVKHLHELKQLLNRCDEASVLAVFRHYQVLASQRGRYLATALSSIDSKFATAATDVVFAGGIKFRSIPRLTGVHSLPELHTRFDDFLTKTRGLVRASEADAAVKIGQQIRTLFVGSSTVELGEDEIGYRVHWDDDRQMLELQSRVSPGAFLSSAPLIELGVAGTLAQLVVSPLLAGSQSRLPTRYALYEFFKKQRTAGVLTEHPDLKGKMVVDYAVAEKFLEDWAACMRRILDRRGLPFLAGDVGNLLALLHLRYQQCVTYDQTGHRTRRPAVPAYLYEYMRDTPPMNVLLFGLKWDLGRADAERYMRVLPESFQKELWRASSPLGSRYDVEAF